jgi:hypothetical protein
LGNNTVVVKVTDNGEPSSSSASAPDAISIAVRLKDGSVWYSNTPSSTLAEQSIGGGNIQVRTPIVGTKVTIQPESTENKLSVRQEQSVVASNFNLTAFPNPATSSFNVKLESTVTADRIQLRVMDINGRTIEVRNNLNAGQTLRLGGDYRPGIYIIEMIQGNNRKQLKLMKQGD